MKNKLAIILTGLIFSLFLNHAHAGPVFLTGHDPDFHAQIAGDDGARHLLRTALNYVTNGSATVNDGQRFLWVESNISIPSDHRRGENGLSAIGLTRNVHYNIANGAQLASVDFSQYTAIGIASSFGGLLTRAELDALIARKDDLETFISNGGGLFAGSECYPCGANLLAGATAPDLFGYLPIEVESIITAGPYIATPFGNSLGLVDSDLNSPTHNSFAGPGGLNIVDTDANLNPTTLAGDVRIEDDIFVPVPEPGALGLLGLGLLGLARNRHRKLDAK